jgi:hypothetical protein
MHDVDVGGLNARVEESIKNRGAMASLG